jgi:hypothetical protein
MAMGTCFERVQMVGLVNGDGTFSDLRLKLGILLLQLVLELGV